MSSRIRPLRHKILASVTVLLAGLFLALAGPGLARSRMASPHRPPARHRAGLPGTPVPRGFVGMNASGPLFQSGDGLSLADQLAAMAHSGVQTLRVAFSWADAQPYPNWAAVPPDQVDRFVDVGGVPTDFAESDQLVLLASLYGLRLLPVVIYTPSWDAGSNPWGLPPPADPAPYARYLTALIARYGPAGTYWEGAGGPRLPIRTWQVWNEPNISYYWNPATSVTGYVGLLRAAHAAIAAADRGAKTVLGAATNSAWTYLAQLYRVPGTRSLFDVAAVNPFTSTPARVLRILGLVRGTMNAYGDRHKPMVVTELSWTSAHGVPGAHFDWDTTPAGQARAIGRVIPLLAAHRRALGLAGFFYYTWVGDETDRSSDWNFAGLLRVVGGQAVPKPALSAFIRAAAAIER